MIYQPVWYVLPYLYTRTTGLLSVYLQALATAFGVSDFLVSRLLLPTSLEPEDLAVGNAGLVSRRDHFVVTQPRPSLNAARWMKVVTRPNPLTAVTGKSADAPSGADYVVVWLPKRRDIVNKTIDVYFSRLNQHRPVLTRDTFEKDLDALYDGTGTYDPGFLCSFYFVLALGTSCECNGRIPGAEQDSDGTSQSLSDSVTQEEFFDNALAIKQELSVSLSSLQALILLHSYLYIEVRPSSNHAVRPVRLNSLQRPGRTLWRLVGSLVRLALELGLHLDPCDDNDGPEAYTQEECRLRVRLWTVILILDRHTSIVLGRPLAVAPFHASTFKPSGNPAEGLSDYFALSAAVSEIQADIICSLYMPTRQSADSFMRHATRILTLMQETRRQLPESHALYFGGTEDWSTENRPSLVLDMPMNERLNLLNILGTRVLLLRALFSSKKIPFSPRLKALTDGASQVYPESSLGLTSL